MQGFYAVAEHLHALRELAKIHQTTCTYEERGLMSVFIASLSAIISALDKIVLSEPDQLCDKIHFLEMLYLKCKQRGQKRILRIARLEAELAELKEAKGEQA